MMGFPFTLLFEKFLVAKGIQVSSVHKVDQNAEKSKHLEPGSLTIFGLKIEFVNLRSEEYAEHTRVPTIVSH
jgi:tRNA nucleotidyltransferase (CCA-adding enzyme)